MSMPVPPPDTRAPGQTGHIADHNTISDALTALDGAVGELQETVANTTLSLPLTTLGDTLFENSVPGLARLPGNVTTTRMFLRQQGTGSGSAAPAWDTIQAGDIEAAGAVQVGGDLGGTPSAPEVLKIQGTAIGAPTGNTANFLREDGTWAEPPGSGGGDVASVFGRTGPVSAESGDYSVTQVTGAAPLNSPNFTGVPTAATATVGANSSQIATTAFVATAVAGGGGGGGGSGLGTTGWLNITKAPYSADPTGAADSTTAINDALSACPPGGVVYVPGGGLFKISGTLVIPDNVTLLGDVASDFTGGSVIEVANGANLNAVISDATWAPNGASESTAPRAVGLVVNGNGGSQTGGKGVGIAFSAYRAEVINCRVQNTRGDGIRLTNINEAGTTITGFCVENKIVDCTVETPGMGNISGNTEGIAVRDNGSFVTDYWIMRNVVYATPSSNGSGIWANCAGGAIIADNHTYGTGTHGIWVSGATETRITNNYVEFFGALAGSGACYGVYAVDDGGGPGTVIGGNVINVDQAVSGNTFTCIFITNPASGDPAFYSLGPNMMFSSVAAATALTIDNLGNAANFVVALMAQNANGFTSPYNINNFATMRGTPFDAHQQPAYASTMSVDPTQGTLITIVLGGNLTMDLPAFFPAGMRITFIFQQPSSGGTYNHTVTWNSSGGYSGGGSWANATFTPATGINAFSSVTFASDGYDLVQVA
jgi:hypothetical protein